MSQKEYLEVHNPSPNQIIFRLDKGLNPELAVMPLHKRKRLMRAHSFNVVIPSGQSKELVSLSGLTLSEIKDSTEFRQMKSRLVIVRDSSTLDSFQAEEKRTPVKLVNLRNDEVEPGKDFILAKAIEKELKLAKRKPDRKPGRRKRAK